MNKEALEQEINAKRRQLADIEAKERKAENVKLIGRCFRYRNNYSLPEKPSDYWWLYLKVQKADGYELTVFEFQTDKYGRIEIKPNNVVYRRLSEGYQEIKPGEFRKAWGAVQRRIKALS